MSVTLIQRLKCPYCGVSLFHPNVPIALSDGTIFSTTYATEAGSSKVYVSAEVKSKKLTDGAGTITYIKFEHTCLDVIAQS